MLRFDSTAATLVLAAGLAAAVGYGVTEWMEVRLQRERQAASSAASAEPAAPKQAWLASAPGRVEPKAGEVRISASAAGRVVEVPVRTGDRVQAGDLLVRLEDEEARARLAAALAEADVRRRERDGDTVGRAAQDRRTAEDAVAAAERALHAARSDFDRLQSASRRGSATAEDVAKARTAVDSARQKLDQERTNLARASAAPGVPALTRLEAALATARAEVSLAELAIERSRIRAPAAGTVLQLDVKEGESAAPGAGPAVTMGDLSALRVKGELGERDIAKVRIGQRATVRSNAFPGQEFTGKVAAIADVLGPPRLGSGSGPRKPTDVDVLEVTVELDGHPPLMPGMRVDVFFAADTPVQSSMR